MLQKIRQYQATSVRRRIIFTFAVIIVLTLGVRWFAHHIDLKRRESVERLIQEYASGVNELTRLLNAYMESINAVSQFVMVGTPADPARIAELRSEIRACLDGLSAIADLPEVDQVIEDARSRYEELVRASDHLMAAVAEGAEFNSEAVRGDLETLWGSGSDFMSKLLALAEHGRDELVSEIEGVRTQTGFLSFLSTAMHLAVFIIAGILIFRLARSITRPIAALSAGVEEFARGNLHVAIEVKNNDEFGTLASHFEKMSHQIQRTLNEGKTVADLGLMVSATLEVDVVAKRLLTVVRQITTARLAVLIMEDPTHGRWLRYRSQGEDAISFDTVDDLAQGTAEVSQASRSIISIPLIAQEKVVGSLELRDFEDCSNIERNTNLVSSLLVSVSMALRNAQFVEELSAEKEKVAQKADELATAYRELEEMQRFKSEFLAGMSHRLRTPLNSVVGCSDLMLGGVFGDTSEKQREALGTIKRCGHSLLGTIDHILNYSRLEAGSVEMLWEDFRVAPVIDDALNRLVQTEALGHTIPEVRVEPPDLRLRSDRIKLRYMLQYLLESAKGSEGPIRIEATAAEEGVALKVGNPSLVLSPERLETLFEPFQDSDENETSGAGLGLTIARRLSVLVDARLSVESTEQDGTHFTLEIPHRDAPAHE